MGDALYILEVFSGLENKENICFFHKCNQSICILLLVISFVNVSIYWISVIEN